MFAAWLHVDAGACHCGRVHGAAGDACAPAPVGRCAAPPAGARWRCRPSKSAPLLASLAVPDRCDASVWQ